MIGLRVHPRLHGYPTEFHDRSNKEQRESCLCNKDYLWILLEASLLVFLVLICSKGSQIFRASSLKKDDLSIDFQPITSEPLEEREIRRTLKNIPHVSDVKCSTFLIPPEEWNQTIEEQSKVCWYDHYLMTSVKTIWKYYTIILVKFDLLYSPLNTYVTPYLYYRLFNRWFVKHTSSMLLDFL